MVILVKSVFEGARAESSHNTFEFDFFIFHLLMVLIPDQPLNGLQKYLFDLLWKQKKQINSKHYFWQTYHFLYFTKMNLPDFASGYWPGYLFYFFHNYFSASIFG